MGDEQALHLPCHNRVDESQKPLASKIETTTDFHNPLIDYDVLGDGIAFQRCPLILQIWPLGR